MAAYYNEIDPGCAQWLRNLIAAGHIAPGDVDERSIEDVRPDDLRGYTQCHFFAGIGVWPYALRRAGWEDSQSVWSGSCPCQPFSAAGQGVGFADERHLWPAFHYLIKEHHEWCKRQKRKAPVIFGEQVASKDADPWIDLVCADMEALGYAFGAVAFPSAGVGAPHIRDRAYWVADADYKGLEGRRVSTQRAAELSARQGGMACGLADSDCRQQQGLAVVRGIECNREDSGRPQSGGEFEPCSEVGGMANTDHNGQQEGRVASATMGCGDSTHSDGGDGRPGPTNGYWRDADWLGCTDGKWRPVEPGTFPLAHGAPARVGRLRAYGNAVNAEAAIAFIGSVMEAA